MKTTKILGSDRKTAALRTARDDAGMDRPRRVQRSHLRRIHRPLLPKKNLEKHVQEEVVTKDYGRDLKSA
ncbi:hypothetical protein [Pararhizobium sp.]|uniref:hypothetical protein n=1 Tax=Pararhizobium sp. TaxID=1977563 RepID=UPI002721B1C0|nr:hypothetical protein [Pararhizobium sp.]MDO9416649.1 hypothetical protein [Pararhizobium sp.]